MKWFYILLLTLPTLAMSASNAHLSYIETYKNLAIAEMHRTGIPASIKLSQAILESNAGRSELALKANNHFGIKCGSGWGGRTHYREDDDYENGKLVKSCFRAFDSVEESYRAHSAFLMGPGKNGRYAFLFDYGLDYKKWARGLKEAGYATDPKYPERLIELIERYELDQYDHEKPGDQNLGPISQAPTYVPPVGDQNLPDEATSNAPLLSETPSIAIRYLNDVKFTETGMGESLDILSQRTGVSQKRIIKYNDHISGQNQLLPTGTRVFLQPKRSSYRGKELWHVVQANETLYDISQRYGLQMKALYKRNRISEGEEPAPGSMIKLKGGLVKTPPALRDKNVSSAATVNDAGYLEIEIVAPSVEKPTAAPVVVQPDKTPVAPPENPRSQEQALYHQVVQGDTLWNIARRYNLDVETLRQINNLVSDQIKIGMQLRIR